MYFVREKKHARPRTIQFSCHQINSQNFIDSTQPTRVNLTELHGFCLHKLLENYAIRAHLASCNSNAQMSNIRSENEMSEKQMANKIVVHLRKRLCNFRMPKNIVWRCGFFNPENVELFQLRYPINGFVHTPHLVRIDHKSIGPANFLSYNATSFDVTLDIITDFQLESSETLCQVFRA